MESQSRGKGGQGDAGPQEPATNFHRHRHRMRAVAGAELAQDLLDVVLDRERADAECLADLLDDLRALELAR